VRVKRITEDLYKNKSAMGLVGLLDPVDLMKALVQDLDLLPKEAAKVVYDLRQRSEGLSSLSIEPGKEYPVPPTHKGADVDDIDDVDENSGLARGNAKTVWGGPGPEGIKRHQFPPDPREEPGDYPYDDVFVNYMNNPKRKKPLMNAKDKETNVKHKNPLDIDLRSGQPGGDGAGGGGIHQRTYHTRTGDQPGSGTSWSTKGKPGWSHHLKDKEFNTPPQSIRKKDKKPVESGKPDNAGDNDGEPQHLKQPNVGQNIPTIGFGGATPIRLSKAGYRGYGRK